MTDDASAFYEESLSINRLLFIHEADNTCCIPAHNDMHCPVGWVTMIGIPLPLTSMPAKSHQGPLPPLTQQQAELSTALRLSVATLAGGIGERDYIYLNNLNAAAECY